MEIVKIDIFPALHPQYFSSPSITNQLASGLLSWRQVVGDVLVVHLNQMSTPCPTGFGQKGWDNSIHMGTGAGEKGNCLRKEMYAKQTTQQFLFISIKAEFNNNWMKGHSVHPSTSESICIALNLWFSDPATHQSHLWSFRNMLVPGPHLVL